MLDILCNGGTAVVSALGMLGSAPRDHSPPYRGSIDQEHEETLGAHESLNKTSRKQSTMARSRSEETLQGWRESTSPGGMSVRLAKLLAAGRARLATIAKVYTALPVPFHTPDRFAKKPHLLGYLIASAELHTSQRLFVGLFLCPNGPRGANTAVHKLLSYIKLTGGRLKTVHPDASEPNTLKMPLQDERVPESMRWQYWGSAATW